MRGLRGWKVFGFFAAVIAFILLVVIQFAQKTPVMLEGDVVLPIGSEQLAQGKRTLFVILFSADERPMPMPYAAARFTLDGDPKPGAFYHFALTQTNLQIMNPNRPRPEAFRLKVRLDADGQAGPDQEGDLVGEIPSVVMGSNQAHVVLDKKAGIASF